MRMRGWEKYDALSVAAARSARREVEWAPARAKRGAFRPLRGRQEPIRLRPERCAFRTALRASYRSSYFFPLSDSEALLPRRHLFAHRLLQRLHHLGEG